MNVGLLLRQNTHYLFLFAFLRSRLFLLFDWFQILSSVEEEASFPIVRLPFGRLRKVALLSLQKRQTLKVESQSSLT